jgi:PadR family transcriptional regulator PadR
VTRRRALSPTTIRVLEHLAGVESEGWTHGYAISRATGTPSGSLYPILGRLERQGLLTSKWQDAPSSPGTPPRHLYQLTDDGRRTLAELRTTASAPRPARVRAARLSTGGA